MANLIPRKVTVKIEGISHVHYAATDKSTGVAVETFKTREEARKYVRQNSTADVYLLRYGARS